MNKLILGALALVLTICLLGSSSRLKPDAVVATVNGRAITVANLDSTTSQLQKTIDQGVSTDSLKRAALDTLISRNLIAVRIDSVKSALDNDWNFCQKRTDDITQTIFKVLFEKQIANRVSVDSAEVVQYYNDHPDTYKEPEQVKARHVLIRRPKVDTAGVESEKEKQKRLNESDKFAKDRAEAVLQKVLAGENWDSLCAKYSEDANNLSKGGELGYFAHGRMVAEFDSAAFKAQPGSIVGPVSTKFGYHVIKVEDHLMPRQKPLDSDLESGISASILNDKQKQASTAFLDSLKTKATYVYNDEKLALPDSIVDPRTWIMVINTTDTIFQSTLNEALPRYKRWKKVDTLTVEDKRDLLGMISSPFLLRQAARELGYMESPEVVKAYNDATNGEANLRIARLLKDNEYEPTDKEVENYFNTNREKYIEKSPLLVHHIIFQDSSAAEIIRDSILAGADFAEMAKRYYPGEPEIREVAYNLDYIGPKDMGPEFYQVADTMTIGSVSRPVKTRWGYHLIKLVNRKQDKTLEQVKPGIRQKLRDMRNAEASAKYVAEWRNAAAIKINEKRFKEYQPPEKKVIHIDSAAPKQKGS